MASPLILRSPQCISCTRRITLSLESAFQLPAQQQLRGLKKDAKVSTTKVLLLQNITKYGPKGTVVSVPSGTMRNLWYPKKMAEYVTVAKINELGIKKDAAVERDSTFPSRKQRKIAKIQQEEEQFKQQAVGKAKQKVQGPAPVLEEAPILEVKQMSPEESNKILNDLLPLNLEFYRTPVTVAQHEERISPSIPRASSVSAAARVGKEAKTPTKTSIYGSVSTNDIATNLKAILAENKQGARVLLAAEDISFVEQTEEKDRVKHLGIFEVEIRLKGAQDVVRRTIQVHAQG